MWFVRGDGITSCLLDHNVMRKLGWEGHDEMNAR